MKTGNTSILKIFLGVSICVIAAGCGGTATTKTPDPTPGPVTVVVAPAAAILIFPAKDALCTQGSLTGTQSMVTLKWNASVNTNSYDVTIKNLITAASKTYTTNTTQQDVILDLSTPYSWFVTSKSTSSTSMAVSEVWKFYNSGPGVVSYAPYPAEIASPVQNANVIAVAGQVDLSWIGTDVDNDIASYDVYFGTSAMPALYKSNVTTTALNVGVNSNTTYYWKIITIDSKGNTSDSGVFQFSVK